jgi:cyclase
MLRERIIPCLDVKNGRVVKGVNFKGLVDAGDPVELARKYYEAGADELTFLDITASLDNRGTILEVVRRSADEIFVPLTVGGGVRSVDDVNALLRAGADKVGINTAALKHPELISQIADRFGNQVIVLSVDAKRRVPGGSDYIVTTHGGTVSTEIDALEWVQTAQNLGAGEILLNSMDADGTKNGFDTEMIRAVKAITKLPVIASGGAGKLEDFVEAQRVAHPDAYLAASIFHFGDVQIQDIKAALRVQNA